MKIMMYRILCALVVIFAMSACNNDGDGVNSATSPLLKMWTLQSIDGVSVNAPADVVKYYFTTDSANPSDTSGIGGYYQYSVASETFEPTPIQWEINQDGRLVITGGYGAGVFDYSITKSSQFSQLELTDVADGTIYIFL